MIYKYSEPLYAHENVVRSEHGTSEIPTYIIDFPESGGVCLKETGTKPIYEMIQANLVNCELNNVIESCVHPNQYDFVGSDNLNNILADFTGIANLGGLADLYAGAKRIENTWDGLPLEVRDAFDSDIRKFVRGFGTEEFTGKIQTGYDKFYGNVNKNIIVNNKPEIKPEIVQPEVPNPEVKEVE